MVAEPPSKRARMGTDPYGPPTVPHALLKYQTEVAGKRVGRYIGTPDDGTLADVLEEHEVEVDTARQLQPSPTLDSHAFELRRNPTAVQDFKDVDKIRRVYYQEMEELVKEASGAQHVIVFDHTIRDTSEGKGPNATDVNQAAGAVQRVHTDYSDTSGPLRVKTLAQSGGYTGVKLTDEEKEQILSRSFLIVNVWRSIAEQPVQTKPLALMDPATLDRKDLVPYEMRFLDRTGENYGLKYNPEQRWYYYPQMEKDECLLFKTWESRKDRPRYCFHAAFADLDEPAGVPPRRSIEVRCVAIMPREE